MSETFIAAPLAAPPAPSFALSEGDKRSVQIALTLPAGVTRLWVWRVSPSGATEYVRGTVGLVVTPSTSLTIFDYEAPIGVPLTYYAQSGNDAGEVSATPTSGTFELTSHGCGDTWLTDIAAPANTLQLVIESLEQLTYEIPTGVHKVIGRRSPIVATDLAQTPAFELALLTATELEREQVRACLGDGISVLLRTEPELGIGNLFFAVLGWAEQRIVRLGTVQDRRHLVNGQEVERPDPKLYVPVTLIASYQNVKDERTDYAEVLAFDETYAALLTTYGIPPGGSVEPWPAHDA